MDERLSKLCMELQRYIISRGAKDERVLGVELQHIGSKTGGVLKTVFGLLFSALLCCVVLLSLYKYRVVELLFFPLLTVTVLVHAFLFLKILTGGAIFGDYPAVYFVVTTHAMYRCDGFYCSCLYSWSFDELTMLEYGEGIVRATSKYFLSDAPTSSNAKAENELYKLNRKHIRRGEPVERRIFSFSRTFTRPPESMPGGSYYRTNGRRYRHNNAPSLQVYTLYFSADSEMPELCRKAASEFRKVKIEKL